MSVSTEQVVGMRKLLDLIRIRLVDCETVDDVIEMLEDIESRIREDQGVKLAQELFL